MYEYEIYLNGVSVLKVSGAEAAYHKYQLACELFGDEVENIYLVDCTTAEIIAGL